MTNHLRVHRLPVHRLESFTSPDGETYTLWPSCTHKHKYTHTHTHKQKLCIYASGRTVIETGNFQGIQTEWHKQHGQTLISEPSVVGHSWRYNHPCKHTHTYALKICNWTNTIVHLFGHFDCMVVQTIGFLSLFNESKQSKCTKWKDNRRNQEHAHSQHGSIHASIQFILHFL